jgi:hypothetical protein
MDNDLWRTNSTLHDRRRSRISLATIDLDTAIETVRLLRKYEGGSVPLDDAAQLVAPDIKQATFANRIYGAAKYRLVETRRDRSTGRVVVDVLPLGDTVLDPGQERVARVKAFLNVPLNREVFLEYRNHPLPSDAKIQAFLEQELGVSKGQLSNARQAMLRSAAQAGFMEHGRDRLVLPPDVESEVDLDVGETSLDEVAGAAEMQSSPQVDVNAYPQRPFHGGAPEAGTTELDGEQHPVNSPLNRVDPAVDAWLQKIPSTAEGWSRQKREKWLAMLGALLEYVFDEEQPPHRSTLPEQREL